MSQSLSKLFIHIIFHIHSTSCPIKEDVGPKLYAYMGGILKDNHSQPILINGVEDHIHILSDLHPSIALADYVRDIKRATSGWLAASELFPDFKGWAEGYGAFTYTWRDREKIINYIRNQREHHKSYSYEDEYRRLLKEFDIKIDERFFPEG